MDPRKWRGENPPEMRDNGRQVMRVPVAQKERDTPRRQEVREVMQHGLRQGQGAFPHLDTQEHFGLRIDGSPDPVR